MKQCKYCGAELPNEAKACSNCGRPLPVEEQPKEKQAEERVLHTGEQSVRRPVESAPVQEAAPWCDPHGPTWSENAEEDLWYPRPEDAWYREQGRPNIPYGYGQPNAPQTYGQPVAPPEPQGWNAQAPYPEYSVRQRPDAPSRIHPLAIIAFFLGLLAIFFNGLLFLPSILSITLAIIALVQIKREPLSYSGKWLAVIGMIVAIGALIAYGVLFARVYDRVYDILQQPEMMQQLQDILYSGNGT